jgi:tetratricopeptide (TPR) repeat protein
LEQLAARFPAEREIRDNLAAAHGNLGNLLNETGRPKEAETAYAEMLRGLQQLTTEFPTRPEIREKLAVSQLNLGNLLDESGRLEEAEAAYSTALAIMKRLATEFPTRPEFRRKLAACHNNQGNLLQATGRLKEAEQAFADSLVILERLAADFPARPEFREELALSYLNQGNLFQATGRLKEAEQAFGTALALQKQLTSEFPTLPEFRAQLAKIQNSSSYLLSTMGLLDDAVMACSDALSLQRQFAKAISLLEANLAQGAGRARDRELMWKANWGRAANLSDLQRHAEAAQAMIRVIELTGTPTQPLFRIQLAVSLARAGDHQKALAEAQALASGGEVTAGTLYDCACVFAICLAACKDNGDQANQYGDLAMELLQKSVAAGYNDAAHMTRDSDLDPLRGRDDFKRLVADLEQK